MRPWLPILTLAVSLTFTVACNRKSEAAIQADEAAKSAEAKVAQLEQQLADAKSGKATGEDADTVQHLTKSQVKALERQVADAKKRAEGKKNVTLQKPTGAFYVMVDVGRYFGKKTKAGEVIQNR